MLILVYFFVNFCVTSRGEKIKFLKRYKIKNKNNVNFLKLKRIFFPHCGSGLWMSKNYITSCGRLWSDCCNSAADSNS